MSETQNAAAAHGKIPALDGLRGLAILMVMVSHFIFLSWPNTAWYRVLQSGWLGVDLFFVLSGFLITGILVGTRERADYFRRFYKRRALRIFPLYFFAILVVWLCVVLVERAPERLHGWDSWGWYVFFSSNIAMAFKGDWTWHSNFLDANHLWSIAVEEQFYILWPLVVWLLPNRILLIVCALLVHFSTPIRYFTDAQFGQNFSMASYMLPYCRMDGLAAGAFLAVFFRLNWHEQFRQLAQKHTRIPDLDKWLVRGLLLWMSVRLFDGLAHGHTQYMGTLSALVFAAILYLALNPHPTALVRRFCEIPFLQHMGKYSYGLYVFHHLQHAIWHKYIETPLVSTGMNLFVAQIIYIGIAFGLTYAMARLSWRYIEEPFLRLKTG